MKILVIKTDCQLDQGTKEILREEAKKAAQTGIMILDGGMNADVIEVDDLDLLNSQNQKPALGVIPKWLHKKQRAEELEEAIIRRMKESREISEMWVEEYNEIIKWEAAHK